MSTCPSHDPFLSFHVDQPLSGHKTTICHSRPGIRGAPKVAYYRRTPLSIIIKVLDSLGLLEIQLTRAYHPGSDHPWCAEEI